MATADRRHFAPLAAATQPVADASTPGVHRRDPDWLRRHPRVAQRSGPAGGAGVSRGRRAETGRSGDERLDALGKFGFDTPSLQPHLFLDARSIVRFGVPPFRIEIMTSIDGVDYDVCRARAATMDVGHVSVPVISLEDLKTNKRAAGRHKDLADLDQLP